MTDKIADSLLEVNCGTVCEICEEFVSRKICKRCRKHICTICQWCPSSPNCWNCDIEEELEND